jgi:hypothetical protein
LTDATTAAGPSPRELRKFGAVLAVALVAVFVLLLPWLFDRGRPTWPWWAAGALLAPALLYPRALAPLHRTWMAVGHVLGIVNSKIVLGALFFLVIVPLGALLRLAGRSPIARSDKGAASYRVAPDRGDDPKAMERPF